MSAPLLLVRMLINMLSFGASPLTVGLLFFPGLDTPTHFDLLVRRYALRWSPTAPYGFFLLNVGVSALVPIPSLPAQPLGHLLEISRWFFCLLFAHSYLLRRPTPLCIVNNSDVF